MASLRLTRAVLSTFAAGALVLAAIAIALVVSPGAAGAATTAVIPLKDAHEGITAGQAEDNDNCLDPLDDLDSDQDGWHFVLDGSDSFTEVRLVFNPGNVAVTINMTDPPGNSGPGWFGFLDNAGSAMKHAYLITDAGWTLVSGEATISYTGTKPTDFQLSHTCTGTPTTKPPTTTTTTTTTTKTTTTTTTTTTGTTGTTRTTTTDDGDLPVTGAGLGGLIAAGLILTAGGAALIFARRRRDADDATPDGGAIG